MLLQLGAARYRMQPSRTEPPRHPQHLCMQIDMCHLTARNLGHWHMVQKTKAGLSNTITPVAVLPLVQARHQCRLLRPPESASQLHRQDQEQ